MNARIIDDSHSASIYNKYANHPLQSWEWGEARKQLGIDVVRIGEFDNSDLINVFQTTFHNIPHTSYTIGYLPRSEIPSVQVLDVLEREANKRNCIVIKIEPYVVKNNQSVKKILSLKLRSSPRALFPKWTQMLDLTKDEHILLKNMKSKTRYNIRLAQKKGVVVKEMTGEKGFEIFSKLYFETCTRQNYRGHNNKYHKTIFNNLKKNNISHILVAFYNNKPLAAYELFIFKKRAYYPYGGSSNEHRNLMASNLLMWEAMKLAKKNKAQIFDMWGSLHPQYSSKDKWAGFTRFKQGYGGEFTEFVGSYDLVCKKALYPVFNSFFTLRHLFLSY